MLALHRINLLILHSKIISYWKTTDIIRLLFSTSSNYSCSGCCFSLFNAFSSWSFTTTNWRASLFLMYYYPWFTDLALIFRQRVTWYLSLCYWSVWACYSKITRYSSFWPIGWIMFSFFSAWLYFCIVPISYVELNL